MKKKRIKTNIFNRIVIFILKVLSFVSVYRNYHLLKTKSRWCYSKQYDNYDDKPKLKDSYYVNLSTGLGNIYFLIVFISIFIGIAFITRNNILEVEYDIGLSIFMAGIAFFGVAITTVAFGTSRSNMKIFGLDYPSMIFKNSILGLTVGGAITFSLVCTFYSFYLLLVGDVQLIVYNTISIFIFSTFIITVVIQNLTWSNHISFAYFFVKDKSYREKKQKDVLNSLVILKDEYDDIGDYLKYSKFEMHGNLNKMHTFDELLSIIVEKINCNENYTSDLASFIKINSVYSRKKNKQLYVLQEIFDSRELYQELLDSLIIKANYADYLRVIESLINLGNSFLSNRRVFNLVSWEIKYTTRKSKSIPSVVKTYEEKEIQKRFNKNNRRIIDAYKKANIIVSKLLPYFDFEKLLLDFRSKISNEYKYRWLLLLCTELDKSVVEFNKKLRKITIINCNNKKHMSRLLK